MQSTGAEYLRNSSLRFGDYFFPITTGHYMQQSVATTVVCLLARR